MGKGRWLEVSPGIDKAPSCAGVYVVVANDSTVNGRRQVLYIGSSCNVRARLRSYRLKVQGDGVDTPWGCYADVVVKVRPLLTEWRELEERLIRRCRPYGNTVFLQRLGRTPLTVNTLDKER